MTTSYTGTTAYLHEIFFRGMPFPGRMNRRRAHRDQKRAVNACRCSNGRAFKASLTRLASAANRYRFIQVLCHRPACARANARASYMQELNALGGMLRLLVAKKFAQEKPNRMTHAETSYQKGFRIRKSARLKDENCAVCEGAPRREIKKGETLCVEPGASPTRNARAFARDGLTYSALMPAQIRST